MTCKRCNTPGCTVEAATAVEKALWYWVPHYLTREDLRNWRVAADALLAARQACADRERANMADRLVALERALTELATKQARTAHKLDTLPIL